MPALPRVDETRCAGGGECVAACPAGCLEMAGPVPWLPRPLDCVYCGICVDVCPTGAMSMEGAVRELLPGEGPPPSTGESP
jgi:formate hydrogenlyase subunit 6/NADH:ubiquinone oxidoreductase subunit I